MGRIIVRLLGIGLAVCATVSAFVDRNVVGVVIFGAITVSLVWFAFRPAPAPSTEVHPLRGVVAIAAMFTLMALFSLAMATGAEDPKARGLGVVAASVGVPSALACWWMVFRQWRRGWQWSSTVTRGELVAASTRREPMSPPSSKNE